MSPGSSAGGTSAENASLIFRPQRVRTNFIDPATKVTENAQAYRISVDQPPGYNDRPKLQISRKGQKFPVPDVNTKFWPSYRKF